MNLKKPLFFSLIALAILFVAAQQPNNDPVFKESMILRAMMAGLTQLHFEPVVLDDKFSSNVYDLYLERLNGGKRFLTYNEYNQLQKYQYEIDDQITAASMEFFSLSYDLITTSLQKTKGFYKEVLDQPFDYDKVEYIELDSEKRKLAENDTELKENWRRQMKYETMVRIADRLESKEEGNEEWKDKTFEEIEESSREAIRERYDRWFNGLEKLDRMDRFSNYLNAITSIYDPHTSYLEPIDKQTFDMNMSGKLEGIGATLTLDGDYTKVNSIVPGGPAWSAGELEVDDLILKVTQGKKGEAENVVGFNLDEVVSRIRGKKGTLVKLYIRKPDNSEKTIEITRDEVKLDRTWAKSLKLDLPDTEEIGYIHLPRFYGDFVKDGRTCSGDIEKEVGKLVDEGAKGIVLDLRNNGGGYLQEVINMTGLFIEDGPVVQEKDRRRDEPFVRNDKDPKVQYDGPLVVLVNEFSASASEIIAAALQDYGRAVIIGSSSTYGKGTVQQFIDLDQAIRGNDDVKPLGSLRVTIRKYYRIDGGSVQLKGVEPDIVLPDSYAFIDTGEKDQEFPLAWTEVDPADFTDKQTAIPGMQRIIAASERRVKDNESFGLITQNAYRIKDLRDNTKYPLNLLEYQAEEKKRDEESKRFEDLDDEIEGLSVSNLKSDMERINESEKSQEVNEGFMESMKTDIYVAEAMRVLSDIIQQSDKSTSMKVDRP